MHKLLPTFFAVCLLLPAAPAAVAQEEEEYDDGAVQCINTRQIRRTMVIDDKNMLFIMRGDKVYHNILPRQCRGLANQGRFSYTTTMTRLCRMDFITVIYHNPFGMSDGPRCSLGLFHEVDPETAAAIIDRRKKKPAPEATPLPMPEPEEPGQEEDGNPEAL